MADPVTASGAIGREAERIWQAWLKGHRLQRLDPEVADGGRQAGHRVQDALEGFAGRRVGWKIAATTSPGMAYLGVDRPQLGRVFERHVHGDGARLASSHMHMGVIEPEIAFSLPIDARGSRLGRWDDLAEMRPRMHLAIEVPNTRLAELHQAGEGSVAADCACAHRVVIGPPLTGWSASDLARQRVTVAINGEERASGLGEAAMGDPRSAFLWALVQLEQLGTPLRADEFVLTGSLSVPVPVTSGDRVEARFDGLGAIATQFT